MAGMDLMIKMLLQNLPPETFQQIGQIGQVVANFQVQLDRIEAKLDALTQNPGDNNERQREN